ncbi:nucleotide 5'-monophosphate nucleosidase PpnN [Alteromonas sp. ASW11-130]|uniref:nucleotide 5'-monophosphate nucleosidase PpnN n=1 Tax=Alteromonas sp. ASW11-130 TaxID=3015775 RepID=UPI0022420DCF|nr:nucleotide 5'-monophosphate nucleosidase PpnN [Alteromonas sp. ASW11-130]MCW8091685.1 nucleotide 5'-monophosphate nucleosidase PpnN [Alteromonas sp. ASW11-130]
MKKVQLNPLGWMSQLSQVEVAKLEDTTNSALYDMFRNCCLAVLNSGVDEDDYEILFAPYDDFDVKLVRRERGVKIELINPPEVAFVDGKLVRGVHEHLFAVLRDLLYMGNKYAFMHKAAPIDGVNISDMVFDMLRHAQALEGNDNLNTIVCWGGHSINMTEYKYTKEVGYQLGLRKLNICTGCGPGAMKGPMKGAAIGHAKQRYKEGRYIGISEPSIIAAEPPNAIVNELVIMPDIEKRLEAFVRIAHGIVIFPGGVGTAEELLYLLGILMNERNSEQPFPVILTGPAGAEAYFSAIDDFVAATLGKKAQSKYQIIIDNPIEVARAMREGLSKVEEYRRAMGDAFSFNWSLKIDEAFQHPFVPTHESMGALALHREQTVADLAVVLRKAFSGIVAGNVKAEGIKQIKQHGPFKLNGEAELMERVDNMLQSFVAQQRMKLPGSEYIPCYTISKRK